MRRLQNSLVAKLILIFCVAMQVVAVMPHHHHGESVHLCMDSRHLPGRDADGQGAAHSHQGLPFAVCPSHSPVMAQPDPREDEMEQTATDHTPDCGCVQCASEVAEFVAENLIAAFFGGGLGGETLPYHYFIVYLTDALPCRAPDFVG